MRVRIYVQDDLTALVVPLDDAARKLSPEKEKMKASAIKTRDADLDDSIIGLDREDTKQGLQKEGHYVNSFGKRMS